MRWPTIIKLRLRSLFYRQHVESELHDELRFHLERQIEANVAAGMPLAEARRRALLATNPDLAKEQCRDARGVSLFEHFAQDLRYGVRLLRKNPGFTAVAVITLALGIGANTAIFSVVSAVLLKPLPYADPGRLITLRSRHSLPDILDIARASRSLEALGSYGGFPLDLISDAQPERVEAEGIGGDVFPALGVPALIGRTFDEADDEARHPYVVVSYRFWRTHLGGSDAALGRQLVLSGVPYTVVGVMPSDFRMPTGLSQLWVPFKVLYPEAVNARGAHFMFAVGRLRRGVTLEQAQTELTAIGQELGRLHPEEARTFTVERLRDRITSRTRRPLIILLGAVALLLLIACANFAHLLLARVAGRSEEMFVRSALGAPRTRLIRQLVTESVLLSVIGGAAGIAVACLGVPVLLSLQADDAQKLQASVLDWRTLLYTIAISLITGVVFGLMPALRLQTAASGSRTTPRSTLRPVLVASEFAMALVLLVGAGLLIRSFWRLNQVAPGFQPDRLLTMHLFLPTARYKEIPTQVRFLRELDTRLTGLPGVESTALVTELPLDGSHMEHNMVIGGRPAVEPGKEPEIATHEVSPAYFETMRIPVLAGRAFSAADREDSQLVGLISESMAKQYWPGQNPIGAQVRWARMQPARWITIIGVVGDVRHDGLDEDVQPTIYTPYTQKLQPWKRFTVVVVRTRADDPTSMADPVKRLVWSVDPLLPVTNVVPMTAIMTESLSQRRFQMLLLAVFASLALLLALVGIYGVTSYLVAQRTREIGIRMALGAQPAQVRRMIISYGAKLIIAGLIMGAAGALAVTRVLRGLLFGVAPHDAVTFACAAAGMLAVALLASYVPARRASAIDPLIALRYE